MCVNMDTSVNGFVRENDNEKFITNKEARRGEGGGGGKTLLAKVC